MDRFLPMTAQELGGREIMAVAERLMNLPPQREAAE